MTIASFIIVLLATLTVSLIASYGFRRRGPWDSFWTFFLILFFAGLAAAFWITPTGPIIWATAWVPIVFVVIVFAILLIAATPSPRLTRTTTRTHVEAPVGNGDNPTTAGIIVGTFFWLFLVLLAFSVFFGAFTRVPEQIAEPGVEVVQ